MNIIASASWICSPLHVFRSFDQRPGKARDLLSVSAARIDDQHAFSVPEPSLVPGDCEH
jgi:hypothetical protein